MLFCFVYIASHPRRSPASFLDQTPVPYAPAPKSLSHNLFADPHPLNLYATIFYKNMPGRGYSRPFDVETFQHADLPPFLTSLPHYLLTSSSLSPLAATLMDLPASVANKRLTVRLSPLAATLTKNRGEGCYAPSWSYLLRSCMAAAQTTTSASTSYFGPNIAVLYTSAQTLIWPHYTPVRPPTPPSPPPVSSFGFERAIPSSWPRVPSSPVVIPGAKVTGVGRDQEQPASRWRNFAGSSRSPARPATRSLIATRNVGFKG